MLLTFFLAGGYMVGAGTTCKYLFDLRPGDVYWCTADCGWITGHTYLTYGPLLNGVTNVLFGSTPAHPDAGRCWRIVEKYNVSGLLCFKFENCQDCVCCLLV